MANKLTTDKGRLRVCRVVDIPLREVSGICLRRGPKGRMSLLAIEAADTNPGEHAATTAAAAAGQPPNRLRLSTGHSLNVSRNIRMVTKLVDLGKSDTSVFPNRSSTSTSNIARTAALP